jgi:hypothetical protein
MDAVLHHGGAGTTGASLRGMCAYMRALFLMTNPNSWSTYSDPSVVRVSTAYELCSPRNCADVFPELAETSIFGHPVYRSSE